MVMEYLDISLPLFIKVSLEKYIELTNIIAPDILPFMVNLDPEKTRKAIEKIKI